MVQRNRIYYISSEDIEITGKKFVLAAGVPVGYLHNGHLIIKDRHKYRMGTRGGREWIAIKLSDIIDLT